MKKIILVLLLFPLLSFGQTKRKVWYKWTFDTVYVTVIENLKCKCDTFKTGMIVTATLRTFTNTQPVADPFQQLYVKVDDHYELYPPDITSTFYLLIKKYKIQVEENNYGNFKLIKK